MTRVQTSLNQVAGLPTSKGRLEIVRCCSSGLERDVEEFSRRFPVLETLGDHAQCQGLDEGNGFVPVLAIAHHAG